jgi:elongation factor Tu
METFQRIRPHINVGTIGHKGHGKSTLTAAITRVMAARFGGQAVTVAQLDASEDEVAAGGTIDTSWVEYQSDTRHFAHVDCPGLVDHISNMIGGASQMDVAILVVSAAEGVMPQTREHLILARQHGAASVIPFINMCDQVRDEQAHARLEAELRALLMEWDYPGDTVPVVRGSALGALRGEANWEDSVVALIARLSAEALPGRYYADVPLRMAIDKTIVLPDNTVAVTGVVSGGRVKSGDIVTVRDLAGNCFDASCLGVRCFDKLLDEGRAGDRATVVVRGLSRWQSYYGQVLTSPTRLLVCPQFEASVYLLTPDDGGRSDPLESGFVAQFHFGTAVLDGTITLTYVDCALPGDSAEMTVRLSGYIPGMTEGMRFSMREGGITVGIGTVIKTV